MKTIKTSKNVMAIIAAKEIGVKPTREGKIILASGKVASLKKVGKSRRYWAFNFKFEGKNVAILVHQFIAYYKEGRIYLEEGMVARHLDDDEDNNRMDNIKVGTVAQNVEDKRINRVMSKVFGSVKTKDYLLTREGKIV